MYTIFRHCISVPMPPFTTGSYYQCQNWIDAQAPGCSWKYSTIPTKDLPALLIKWKR